jgi:ribosomal protein S18 acetylase RimI-like enzyme
MSHEDDVAIVGRSGYRAAAAAISAGHAEYPSFRHLFPQPTRRARALRAFFEVTVRDAIPFGSVLATGEGGRVDAIAVWLPPGAFPWSASRKLRATPSLARVLLADPRAFPAFARYGSLVERHHRGDVTSWYLEVLSVRPEYQRRGLGTRLLKPILERADRDQVSCRLETSDPSNVAYYEQFGFAVDGPLLEVLRNGPHSDHDAKTTAAPAVEVARPSDGEGRQREPERAQRDTHAVRLGRRRGAAASADGCVL